MAFSLAYMARTELVALMASTTSVAGTFWALQVTEELLSQILVDDCDQSKRHHCSPSGVMVSDGFSSVG